MAYLSGRAYFLSKKIGKAITDYGMLADGDRVAVAVSGGKDSLSLLRILRERQKFVPIKYEIVAVYVDLGFGGVNPEKLERYLRKSGMELHIEKSDVLRSTDHRKINCFWCSWNRRKALFEAADRLGCSKVAFGHHKDDIIQTILLNLFFHGEVSAMCPKQELFG
ncbi:MAG: ATP-binding protein, partial [Candidatus Omnitrophota bacterium]